MKALLIGDSQMAGPMGRALASLLRSDGWEVERIGNVGWGVNRYVRNMLPELQRRARTADVVIYVFGSNDTLTSGLENNTRALRRLSNESWYIGAPVYGRSANTARTTATRPVFERVFGNRYIDSRPMTSPIVGRTLDGVHFTASGGQAWAQRVYREWAIRRTSVKAGLLLGAIGGILWAMS